MRSEKGLTIIELLAVSVIFVIITTIVAGILTFTLRATNKSKTITDTSQNGAYALSVMSNLIVNSVGVTKVDKIPITSCAVEGGITGTSITLLQSDGQEVTLSCDIEGDTQAGKIASDGASLIDQSRVKVKFENGSLFCSFTCRQPVDNPYTPPIIEVAFTLTNTLASQLFEQSASANFKSSITLRAYNP